jgi:hypothetical protein
MLQSLDEVSRDNVWHRIQAMRRSAAAAQKGGGSNSNGGSSSSKQPHVAARCQPSGSQTSTASGEEAKGETTEQKNTPQQPAAPGSSAGATPYSSTACQAPQMNASQTLSSLPKQPSTAIWLPPLGSLQLDGPQHKPGGRGQNNSRDVPDSMKLNLKEAIEQMESRMRGEV